MDITLFILFLFSFLFTGGKCEKCYSYEESHRISFECPESCCSSSSGRQCCKGGVQVWGVILAVVMCILFLGCLVALIVLWMKSCTRTAGKGRVIRPAHSMRMPAPPPYHAPGANPPPYTATSDSAWATTTRHDPVAVIHVAPYHPEPQPIQESGRSTTDSDYVPTDNSNHSQLGGLVTQSDQLPDNVDSTVTQPEQHLGEDYHPPPQPIEDSPGPVVPPAATSVPTHHPRNDREVMQPHQRPSGEEDQAFPPSPQVVYPAQGPSGETLVSSPPAP